MGGFTVSRAILAVAGIGALWVGIGFAAIAIVFALAPVIGMAGGAAVAAAVLMIPPFLVALFSSHRPVPRIRETVRENREKPPESNDPVLAALSSVAWNRPLIAIFGVGLLGLAEVLLKGKRK